MWEGDAAVFYIYHMPLGLIKEWSPTGVSKWTGDGFDLGNVCGRGMLLFSIYIPHVTRTNQQVVPQWH